MAEEIIGWFMAGERKGYFLESYKLTAMTPVFACRKAR